MNQVRTVLEKRRIKDSDSQRFLQDVHNLLIAQLSGERSSRFDSLCLERATGFWARSLERIHVGPLLPLIKVSVGTRLFKNENLGVGLTKLDPLDRLLRRFLDVASGKRAPRKHADRAFLQSLGRKLPVETVCNFSSSVSCKADVNGALQVESRYDIEACERLG
jgi:hypothetical protein